MSFQDVGKPGAPQRPLRSHYATQAAIPEGRPSGSLPKIGDPFAQLSDGILQYQVRNICIAQSSTCDGSPWLLSIQRETHFSCSLSLQRNVGILEKITRQMGTDMDGPELQTQ